ncbi:PIG-L family deacetylase, partial [Streptomyces sp. NPDC031705]
VAGRADTGTVAATTLGGPRAWTESRMLYAGAPSAVLDPAGTTTTAVLGLDARLHTTTTRPTAPHPTWHPAVLPPGT